MKATYYIKSSVRSGQWSILKHVTISAAQAYTHSHQRFGISKDWKELHHYMAGLSLNEASQVRFSHQWIIKTISGLSGFQNCRLKIMEVYYTVNITDHYDDDEFFSLHIACISSGRMGFCQLRPTVQYIHPKENFLSNFSSLIGWKAPRAPACTFKFWQLGLNNNRSQAWNKRRSWVSRGSGHALRRVIASATWWAA